jgi:hypothetical protein
MPLDETIETFGYFLKEAERLDLAYICFLRYTDGFDLTIDGRVLTMRHPDPLELSIFFVQAKPAGPNTMSSPRTVYTLKLHLSFSMVASNRRKLPR